MAVDVKTIGIIGAGQMGSGIAQICARSGYAVKLSDIDADALGAAVEGICSRLQVQVSRDRMTSDMLNQTMANIETGTEYGIFTGCDLIIEAATENEAIKRAIFGELTPHLRADALLATNTSSISITRLAAATDRPGRFIGLHFMNPVPAMKLVEIIRGIATDDDTFAAVREVAGKLGKTAVVAADFPAFIVNRVLLPMINEAVYALHEGVASAADIDAAMKLGANHPMGPLELADFIGLDTCLAIMRVLHDGLADTKYRPCPLLVKYVDAGWLGRKTGRGFYDYSGDTPVPAR
jgi:3-hydroxybutyryl-CoA dehydrogenase